MGPMSIRVGLCLDFCGHELDVQVELKLKLVAWFETCLNYNIFQEAQLNNQNMWKLVLHLYLKIEVSFVALS